MRHGAWLKYMIMYLFLSVTVFLLLNTYGAGNLKNKLVKEKLAMLSDEATLISDEYVTPYYNDAAKLSDMRIQLNSVATFLNTRIWVMSAQGNIVVDTSGSCTGRVVDNIAPGFMDDILEKGYLSVYRQSNISSAPFIASLQPIYKDYTLRGYVCIFMSMSVISDNTTYYLNFINITYLWFLMILFLAFLIMYMMGPMQVSKMITAAKEYSSGHFDVKCNVTTHDEYQLLSETINYMAEELNNLDDYQKKFIANVSHDFKSPLTSIKGYTEAMLDGTIPVEEQGRYLDIIAFETERLTKLTNNLLLLNSFENKGVHLEITVFDVNAMIKKTAMTFEGICTKKKITLNLEFVSDEENVSADFGRIQQVLYNLIDNAIKFSHQNSTVDIITEEKGSKVMVSVKDHGIGIPKDAINKIWERFYKTDLSRGKDKKGTGLGLSIAKEIIEAHDENITVVSTEGAGTEFTFSLPSA